MDCSNNNKKNLIECEGQIEQEDQDQNQGFSMDLDEFEENVERKKLPNNIVKRDYKFMNTIVSKYPEFCSMPENRTKETKNSGIKDTGRAVYDTSRTLSQVSFTSEKFKTKIDPIKHINVLRDYCKK